MRARFGTAVGVLIRLGLLAGIGWVSVAEPRTAPIVLLLAGPSALWWFFVVALAGRSGWAAGELTLSPGRARLLGEALVAKVWLGILGLAYFGGLVLETRAGVTMWAVLAPALFGVGVGWAWSRRMAVGLERA